MNKKAILLKWTVGIIIGIVLVAFAMNFISDIFRLSSQAKENFNEFTQTIIEVSESKPGTIKKMIFIQDQATYVYPINDQSRNFHFTKDPIFGNDVDFTLITTNDCVDQNCYCLCRETYQPLENRNCKPNQLICEPMPNVNFSKGTGVVIDRGYYREGLASTVGLDFTEDQTGPRRQQVQIIKCGNGAPFCKKSKEGDVSIIFDWIDEKGIYATNGVK